MKYKREKESQKERKRDLLPAWSTGKDCVFIEEMKFDTLEGEKQDLGEKERK